ncbi:plasmid recombination protein, partial [Aerococcus viridans]
MGVFLMAHVAKYTRGGIKGLSNHLDRKTENHSNKDIDVSKSHL